MASSLVVIGGGIAGLTLTLSLGTEMAVEVYDQARPEEGAALAIAPNAMQILRELGVADAVTQSGTKVDRYQFLNQVGTVLKVLELGRVGRRYGESFWCVPRQRLIEELRDALPITVSMRTGRLTQVAQDRGQWQLNFAEGFQREAPFLVGADGMASVVRRSLLASEGALRFRHFIAFRALISMTHVPWEIHSAFQVWGEGREFGFARVNEDQVYWYATIASQDAVLPPVGEAKGLLRQRFSDWVEPVPSLVEATTEEDILMHAIYDRDRPPGGLSARATLIGDAAHPMTPNLGQGACQSIIDGYTLGQRLRRLNPQEAFSAYQQARWPKAAEVAYWSRTIGGAVHLEVSWLRMVRDVLFRFTPSSLLTSGLAELLAK